MKKPNRAFISMLAFITVAVFLISYFSIVSFATENIYPIDKYNIDSVLTRDDFSDLTYKNYFLFDSNNSNVQTYRNIINNNPSVLDNNYLGDYMISEFSNYIWTSDGFYLGDNKTFFAVNSSEMRNFIYMHIPDDIVNYLQDSSSNYVYIASINSSLVYTNAHAISLRANSLVQIDGDYYYRTGYYEQILVNTNCAVYPFTNTDSVTTLQDVDNINPNYHGSMSDEDKTLEHMSFSPSGLYIDSGSKWDGGLVTYVGMDFYQRTHKDEYTFQYSYEIKLNFDWLTQGLPSNDRHYNFTFTGSTYSDLTKFNYPREGFGTQNLTEILSCCRGSNSTPNTQDPFDFNTGNYTALQLFNWVYNQGGFYDKNDTINLGLTMGNIMVTVPICYGSFGSQVGVKACEFNITCTYYKNGDECYSIINYYNLLSGKSSVVNNSPDNDTSMTNASNYNQANNLSPSDSNYKNPSDYQSSYNSNGYNLPSASGGGNAYGGSSSATGGSPSVNVNTGAVNVNTSQDPKAVVDYVKGELVPTGDAVGFVDKLTTVTESNNFVSYMSSTFSFLPSTFWSNLSVYFEIFLGILVGFFVLRLILDLL